MNSLDELINSSDLEEYDCIVWLYKAGHSRLFIRVISSSSDSDDYFYLGFQNVFYFSGPMTWSEAEFRYGTYEETMDFINKDIVVVSADVQDDFLKHHRLFIVENSRSVVKILAHTDVEVVAKENINQFA